MTDLERQTIKGLTWKTFITVLIGTITTVTTIAGGVYAIIFKINNLHDRLEMYQQKTDLEIGNIQRQQDKNTLFIEGERHR